MRSPGVPEQQALPSCALRFSCRRLARRASSPSPDKGALPMTAFNAVRFRVKPGRDQEFLDAHKNINADWPGLHKVNMIKTGERSYCIIAEWDDMNALANARPNMIKSLDSFRDTLEDLGGGLGVTDPVSGPVVLALK
jgi:Antibiotic biosynthesis monooxygenase